MESHILNAAPYSDHDFLARASVRIEGQDIASERNGIYRLITNPVLSVLTALYHSLLYAKHGDPEANNVDSMEATL